MDGLKIQPSRKLIVRNNYEKLSLGKTKRHQGLFDKVAAAVKKNGGDDQCRSLSPPDSKRCVFFDWMITRAIP